MEKVTVKKVETAHEMNDFVKLPNLIYSDSPYYIPDLEMDVKDTFNPKNVALEQCNIQAFIAYDEENKPVGRIAGIINHRANKKWNIKTVRFEFIEFIDDPKVSTALLSTVEQ